MFNKFSARRITGHILKVDGGKTLTSRGQVDWFGWQYMTRKFENDSTSYYNFKIQKETKKPMPAFGDREGLEDWIEDTQQSRWAIKSDEAHLKQTSMYQNNVSFQKNEGLMAEGSLSNPKVAH